jgi:hypothetical protein
MQPTHLALATHLPLLVLAVLVTAYEALSYVAQGLISYYLPLLVSAVLVTAPTALEES